MLCRRSYWIVRGVTTWATGATESSNQRQTAVPKLTARAATQASPPAEDVPTRSAEELHMQEVNRALPAVRSALRPSYSQIGASSVSHVGQTIPLRGPVARNPTLRIRPVGLGAELEKEAVCRLLQCGIRVPCDDSKRPSLVVEDVDQERRRVSVRRRPPGAPLSRRIPMCRREHPPRARGTPERVVRPADSLRDQLSRSRSPAERRRH